ncbi:glycosyltransferase family 4 protein [Amylibacter sp. SFDW26]|uniref:glycosyltransferase family 4 protein n=1 Tax=Amylibacter sp. SFDW26 TaxID=2652722 RepID=UPI001261EF64|nr:glycosyltransferase family 4 protein [Amylibacter sp. SFDW26]KAB7616005.1 glycosyltransferase family 4 protein [Amylibacter sp. SFDW26]
MDAIAFYAPMKSPTHPMPSGDRQMARGIFQLLKENAYGYNVVLASELRIYDGTGDLETQNKLINQANTEIEKLIKQGQIENWAVWITYHNYYKAPDLIGPTVARTLGIPYVLLEATRAHKRLTGPWSSFAKLAETASDQANIIFYFTEQDKQALEAYKTNTQQILHLPPFLLQDSVNCPERVKPHKNTLLSVGMMRSGAKTKSYALIAEVLKHLKTNDWHLNIIGDGENISEIKYIFQKLKGHISFLGQRDKSALNTAYSSASVFLWPGVDEAYGMVYLEAQAAGLPIIAQARPGVRDVISPDTPLHPTDDPKSMARAIDRLLTDDVYWQLQSKASLDYIAANHLKLKAAKTLWSALTPLLGC